MESNCKGVFVKRFHIEHYITMLLRLCNQIIETALEIWRLNTRRRYICASEQTLDIT